MKKTLSTLLFTGAALVSTALSEETDWQRELILGMDFDDKQADVNHGFDELELKTATGFGSTTALQITTNNGNINYATDVTGAAPTSPSYLYSHHVGGKTFSFTSPTGIDGITASRGFTISFAAHNASTKWSNLLGFEYGGIKFQVQFGGGNSLELYNSSDGSITGSSVGGAATAGVGFNQEWAQYAISVSGSTLTMMAVSAGGDFYSHKIALTGITDSNPLLTQIIGGGNIDYKGNGELRNEATSEIDNFALYNGAIEQKHLELIAENTFAGNGLTLTVPEPTTASLSMLALAGLLARRRRKSA